MLLLVAAAIWLPNVHRLHALDAPARSRLVAALVERQVAAAAEGTQQMRRVNPEWDFMRRTYTVLALANLAVDAPDPERARLLSAIDAIVDATLRDDASLGPLHFLMPYERRGPFVDPSSRSPLVDGEIVMMLAARELVEPRPETRAAARERAARIVRSMSRSPSMSGESYPNECWTFCNTTALAGLALLDRVDGADAAQHAALAGRWVQYAREHLTDGRTGLLVSSFTYDGITLDGPEGSSVWMSAHNLLLVDPAFAEDQYARARRELGGGVLGYAWAREWPRGVTMHPDVDSGPIVPWLDASAGSSGLALLGASAFGDQEYLGGLLASLELAGFRDGGRYLASNAVGDAVILYALTFGPLWRRARSGA
ncbi:hypothetical protein BH11MYX4_BH11MYX4_21990 [soil metagenome]